MFTFFLFFYSFLLKPQIAFEGNSCVVSFSTEEVTRCQLFYGKDTLLDTLKEEKGGLRHQFLLSNLTPGERYRFQIRAGDYLFPKIFKFSVPSADNFRILYLPGIERIDSHLIKFLTEIGKETSGIILLTKSIPPTLEKGDKVLLFPVISPTTQDKVISYFDLNLSFQKKPEVKKSSFFSILFSSKEKSLILSGDEGYDLVFLPAGNHFARTYPIIKNPYSPLRPGLILSSDSFSYPKKGVVYFFVPDGENPSLLPEETERLRYLAFAQSGAGLVEILKGKDWLKVKTYLFREKEGDYIVVDSFSLYREKEEEELKILGVGVKEVKGFTSQVSFKTNLPATSLVEWGTKPGEYRFRYPPLDINQVFRKEHTLPLFGLMPEERYFYRVGSRRGEKIIWSEERSFITLTPKEDELILAVDFAHPLYKSEANFFCTFPFSYPQRDSGPMFCGIWDKDLEFSFLPQETSLVRSTQHWIRNSEVANWSWEGIIPGRCYYEIGSFSSPDFSGPTKITIAGKALIKEEGDTVFSGEIELRDFKLNLQLGYGDSLVPGYSGISYLILSRQRKKKERTVFLLSATPNPFKNKTVLKYHLIRPRRVIAEVYDATGKRLFTLKNKFEGRGYQECVWDGRDLQGLPLPDGVYFISIATEDEPPWRVKISLLRE